MHYLKKKETIKNLISEEIEFLLKKENKDSWALHFTDRMFWLKDEIYNNKAVAERVFFKKKMKVLTNLFLKNLNIYQNQKKIVNLFTKFYYNQIKRD